MTKLLLKKAFKIIIAIIYSFFLLDSMDSYAGNPSVSVKSAALEYLAILDKNAQIFVWPTRYRPYEIIGGNPEISKSVSSFIESRWDTFRMTRSLGVSQISVIEVKFDNFPSDITSLLQNSTLLPAYKSFAHKASLNGDGCTAYRFIDRETWISVGLIFVDENKFGIGDEARTNSCVFGALDYVNGLPTKDTYFEYMSLPQEPARALILEAVHRCAADGDNQSRQDETTMDGITPLPSLGCVSAKIGQ